MFSISLAPQHPLQQPDGLVDEVDYSGASAWVTHTPAEDFAVRSQLRGTQPKSRPPVV
jgi:hypothetical protein